MVDSWTDEVRVRRAREADLPATKALLDAASQWLIARGIRQWDRGYMPLETLVGRLERGELYVCLRDGEVVGTLALQGADPDLWGEDGGRCLYLHTLVVRPDLRGTGLGHRMLEWAEHVTREEGRILLRLDCLAEGMALRCYYREAGYTEVSIKQMNPTWRAALFEKRL
jgi:N-acetylglutamate synthase-like GNAT family acetyltransferase